jgi:hypothetical protein
MYSEAHKECTIKSIAKSKKAIAESKKITEGQSKDGTHENEVVISQFEKAHRMKDNTCFYIKSTNKNAEGKEFVVATQKKDKYAPKTTGIYNVEMQIFDQSKA